MKRKQPVMDWPAVKAELHRQGMTLTALAERNGLSSSSCRQVSIRPHYRAQEVIAKFVGHKPEDLWPDRYPKNKPRILDTVKFPPVTSQKSSAVADNRRSA